MLKLIKLLYKIIHNDVCVMITLHAKTF